MSGYRRDPIENDSRYAWMIQKAEKEAEAELAAAGIASTLGYCHMLWPRQKRILKEKYGINWKTPAEMNPDILFD